MISGAGNINGKGLDATLRMLNWNLSAHLTVSVPHELEVAPHNFYMPPSTAPAAFAQLSAGTASIGHKTRTRDDFFIKASDDDSSEEFDKLLGEFFESGRYEVIQERLRERDARLRPRFSHAQFSAFVDSEEGWNAILEEVGRRQEFNEKYTAAQRELELRLPRLVTSALADDEGWKHIETLPEVVDDIIRHIPGGAALIDLALEDDDPQSMSGTARTILLECCRTDTYPDIRSTAQEMASEGLLGIPLERALEQPEHIATLGEILWHNGRDSIEGSLALILMYGYKQHQPSHVATHAHEHARYLRGTFNEIPEFGDGGVEHIGIVETVIARPYIENAEFFSDNRELVAEEVEGFIELLKGDDTLKAFTALHCLMHLQASAGMTVEDRHVLADSYIELMASSEQPRATFFVAAKLFRLLPDEIKAPKAFELKARLGNMYDWYMGMTNVMEFLSK